MLEFREARWSCRAVRAPVTRVFSLYVVQAGSARPHEAGRPAPTAFNQAGEKLRAAGRELPRVSSGAVPDARTGSLSPSSGEEGLGRPCRIGQQAPARQPPPGLAGRPGSWRRRRRPRDPSWCRGRPWSRSSAARRRRTRRGPWRAGPGPRPVPPCRAALRRLLRRRRRRGSSPGTWPPSRGCAGASAIPRARRSAAARAGRGGRYAHRRGRYRKRCRTGTARRA